MAEDKNETDEGEEEALPVAPAEGEAAAGEPAMRALTADQRKLLGGPRSLRKRIHERRERAAGQGGETAEPAAPVETPEPAPPAPAAAPIQIAPPKTPRRGRPQAETTAAAAETSAEQADDTQQDAAEPSAKKSRSGQVALVDQKTTRVVGLYHAIVVLGALFILFLTFYIGKNAQRWKYMLFADKEPELSGTVADKFPNVPADELIQQGFAAEAAGDWRGAADRFIAAKYKDRGYRGLLFRVGKIFYDQKEFGLADSVFANAIAFGENVDASNYFRGLIATSQRNMPAAERFFAAAAAAEPMVATYYYYWAEALRIDLRPAMAIPHYEQAVLRARTEQDRALYRFKIRICELESAGSVKVATAIAEKKNAGPLPIDWLMTAAALEIHEGRVTEGIRLIGEARAGKNPGLFVGCVTDMYFRSAGLKNPQISEAIKLEFDPAAPAFQ